MIVQNLRYSIRALRRTPLIALIAIATLALGIGANTALFSVINAVLLRPLSYPHPERIVELLRQFPRCHDMGDDCDQICFLARREP